MDSFRQLRELPREVWVVCAAALVNRLGTMALPFLSLYLTRQIGLTPALAGSVFLVYGGALLVASPFAGRLIDRFGARRVMIASLVSGGAAMLAFPLAVSFRSVCLATALWAGCAELFRPAFLACVGQIAPPELRKPAFALSRLAINLGISVGAPVGGLVSEFSLPLLFVINASSFFASAVFLACAPWREPPPTAPAEADSGGAPAAPLRRGPLADRRMLSTVASTLLVSVVFFQFEGPLPLFLAGDLGLSGRWIGAQLAINTLLIVAIEVPLTAALSHWSHRRQIGIASLLVAAGFGAYALVTGALGASLCVVVWTFGEMLLFPAQTAHVADLAPPGQIGRYMGVYNMTFGIAITAGPWLGNLAYQHLGPEPLWAICFAVAVGAALLTWSERP